MTRLLLCLFFAVTAWGQLTATVTGPATAARGSSVTLTLNIAGNTTVGPEALQWTLGLPVGYTITGVTNVAANKGTQCNTLKTTCVCTGLVGTAINRSVMAAGPVASITVLVPASAAAGAVSFSLSGLVAADTNAFGMWIASGTAYSLTIPPLTTAPTDINGDGVTNATDVQLMLTQVLNFFNNGTPCANDPHGDGVCNLYDVEDVLHKAMGL